MSLSVGMIGMPNVGKTTLFNALTQVSADASNYPFCTKDQNIGMAEVPDTRLERLNELLEPKECTPTFIEFIDIAGLVRGASHGEGLGNRFLGHIREVDAVLHVVRCFEDENVTHVDGAVDPVRDMETVGTELLLADLDTVERAIHTQAKSVRARVEGAQKTLDSLEKIREGLEQGTAVRALGLSEREQERVREYAFLTAKPMLYVANVGEDDVAGASESVRRLKEAVGSEKVLPISAEIEEEIGELEDEGERKAFLSDLGLEETGLNRIEWASYRLLHLITFYTIANEKLRAWQVVEGTGAQEAAGKIHTDMEHGFIRAEVMTFEDVAQYKTMAELHRHGRVRAEGKEYAMRDGDVVHILFHV
jgi:GTP-binding protein YchF